MAAVATPAAGTTAQVDNTKPYIGSTATTTAAQTGAMDNAALTTAAQSKDGTVQGQLANIIDTNSPLMQRAAAKADTNSNARGLLNSSMAVGASQGAVMDAAMPIAQADAASNNQFALTNAAASNQNAQFNASANNQGILMNTQNNQDASKFNANAQNTTNATNAQLAQANDVQNTVEQNKMATVRQDALNKQYIADSSNQAQSASAANAAAAQIMSMQTQQIQAIQSNSSMDAAAKTKAINELIALNKNTIDIVSKLGGIQITNSAGQVVPLSSLLNYSAM